MSYFFTLLYLVTAYLTPPVLFGSLTDYHVEVAVVILAIVSSIPNFSSSGLSRAPQTIALAGLAIAIFISIAQSGWLGGTIGPLYGFLQPAFAFLLVAVNCKRKWHFTCIIVMFFLGSVFFMYMGLHDLQANVIPSDYLWGNGTLRRLRGLGFVHDPNDLSQVMVSLVPCIFLWKKKFLALNLLLLGIPIAVLLVGIYLTHSRGAMVAMAAVVLFSARRKVGLLPASLLAALLVAAMFALGWSGGRDISMDSGADRLDLWYDGIESLKAHPIFGMGLGNFVDKYGITAHNSVVICAAELGVVGLFFWILLIVSSMRAAMRFSATPLKQVDGDLNMGVVGIATDAKFSHLDEEGISSWEPVTLIDVPTTRNVDVSSIECVSQLQVREGKDILRIMPIALVGMLTAGWFLSRTFSMFLFMYFGMVYAAQRMTQFSTETPAENLPLLFKISAATTAAAILVLYVIMRARNIIH